MKTPIIFKKNTLQEMKKYAQLYTPEWVYDEENPDFGVVFCRILDKLYEDTIRFFNKVPQNYYINFLNLLGAKIESSVPAKGMISVNVTEGTDGAYIEKGSQLTAQATDGSGEVTFETSNALYAVDANLNKIIFTNGKKDFISVVFTSEEGEKKEIEPFNIFSEDTPNMQSHQIYIGDPILFLSKEKTYAEILIEDTRSRENNKALTKLFSDKKSVIWSYYDGNDWIKVEDIETKDNTIKFKFDGVTNPYDACGKESRYLRCEILKLPKKGINLTGVKISSKAEGIDPDIVLCNSEELASKDYFPFGDELSTYTDFHIASEEAFTKAGSTVSIDVEMQFVEAEVDGDFDSKIKYKSLMKRQDFEEAEPETASILKVNWEYWNGLGWSKLYKDNSNEDFFCVTSGEVINKKLEFKCPSDMDKSNIGPLESYFIRARITKIKNPYNSFQKFITPYIHQMKIGYDYKGDMKECEEVVAYSDLNSKVVSVKGKESKGVIKSTLAADPTMFFCIDKPIEQGPFKIFFEIDENINDDFPVLQWEYYGHNERGEGQWLPLQVSDLTNNFEHSGVVTFMGKSNFKETEVFGAKGYFVRIVNIDGRYGEGKKDLLHPKVKAIIPNVVNVIQKETLSPEYFSIDQLEPSKKCKLFKDNVLQVRVWIDEFGELSAVDEEYFIENADGDSIVVEYDEFGGVSNIWIEWKEFEHLSFAGPLDRAFEVDYSKGIVEFGDSIHGKIPATRDDGDSIKIVYSISGGASGNVAEGSIGSFLKTITYVSSVQNDKQLTGGVNRENIDEAAWRMRQQLAGMGKMVSANDFEETICRNNRSVYRVKCVPHVNYKNEKSPGTIAIAVLPKQHMQGYEKFEMVKKDIYDFVKQKAPITMLASGKLEIFEVRYIEVSTMISLVVSDYDDCQDVREDVKKTMEELLNPITGGVNGTGWKIGTLPSKEQLYNAVKSVKKIKWVKRVSVFTKVLTPQGKKDVDLVEKGIDVFSVPICGEVYIDMAIESDNQDLTRR